MEQNSLLAVDYGFKPNLEKLRKRVLSPEFFWTNQRSARR